MLELCGLEEEIFLQVDKNRRLEPPDFVYVVKYINPGKTPPRRVPGTVGAYGQPCLGRPTSGNAARRNWPVQDRRPRRAKGRRRRIRLSL